MPWNQALDLVLKTNQLEANREGNVMRISSVKRLKEEREAMRLNDNIEQRDGQIAGLKSDIISLQTGQTDTDAARRRAVQPAG